MEWMNESPKPEKPKTIRQLFSNFARATSCAVGSVWAFVVAIAIILIWGISGPIFHYSDTWQLVINTGTTIVTFIMVFLIQATQNRDAKAFHLKLDEIIRSIKEARNSLVDLEDMEEDELEATAQEFKKLHQRAGELEKQFGEAKSGETSDA